MSPQRSTTISLVILLFSCASPLGAASQPNFVLIMADDLGWADVPWHGSEYNLPVLAKLAPESVLLEAHYVHPMCSPTRAALLSGRYASRFGVTGAQNQRAYPFDTVTLAGALRAAGYETALIGKWHLGSKSEWGPNLFGFDHAYGSLAGGCGPYNHRYKRGEFTQTWHRNGELIEEQGHITDLLAREAIRWLEQRAGEKPFFLYLPFTAIHVPIEEPQKWHEMNSRLTDPAKQLRAACTSHMDHVIGQVVDALDRKGERDDTLLIFISDNGAHGPSDNQGGPYPGDYGDLRVGNDNGPLHGHKGSVWEGGIRTPGLVNWPGKLSPRELHTPLSAVDWMPTLCALAGAKPAGELKWDGRNVWPVLAGEKELPVRTIYSAGVGFRSAAIRRGDWKLIVSNGGDGRRAPEEKESLFNLAEDLGETRNLAAERPEVLAEMKRHLAEVTSRDNDARVRDE